MGIIRTRFQIETVQELRKSLKAIDSGLLVAHDTPENFISQLVRPNYVTTVVYQLETSDEEVKIEEQVQEAVSKEDAQLNMQGIWGSSVHHIDDLPYDPYDYFPNVVG